MSLISPYFALGNVEIHDVWSNEVGDTFRIFIGHCGEDPHAMLCLPDANGLFGLCVDTVRMMQLPMLIPSMVVVGIGYPDAATYVDTSEKRARDFTPTHRSMFSLSGGANAFLRFMQRELFPWLNERFPTCLEERTYFGHSLGGLFGTHVLLTEPETFHRYILSSPSLWWDNETIFEQERRFSSTHNDLHASVYFGIGSHETDAGRRLESANLPKDHPSKPPAQNLDMVDDLERFVAQLTQRSFPSLMLNWKEFDDEFHNTVAALVLSHGLRCF